MKGKKLFRAFVVFAFFFTMLTEISARDEWISVRSKNFELFGNAAEKDVRAVGVKLEQFRAVFRHYLSRANLDSPVPIKVVVFKDDTSFAAYKPLKENGETRKTVVGYFLRGDDANYVALSVGADTKATFETIFHEYVHFIVGNNLGEANVPPWFSEGLAEYYQTIEIESERKITLGAVQKSHLALLQQNSLIPFDAFFNFDNYSLRRQTDDGAGLFYAQAWALMHYLMHGNNGARSAQLYKFVELATGGKSAKDAFREAFEIDYAAMEAELKKYVEQNSFRAAIADFGDRIKFDTEMRASALSEAEEKAILGDLLLKSNRLTEAEKLLRDALAIDSKSVKALTTLGLIKARQKKFDEAEKILEKAVETDAKDYLAFYSYAFVLSREDMTDYGFVAEYDAPRAALMRKALRKAIELNPFFAPSYDLYAFISAVRNDAVDEAIEYLQKALEIAPGNERYLIRQAELLLRKESYTNARAIILKVLQSAADKETKLYAQNTLDRINSTEAQMLAVKNFKRRPDPEYVTDKPLSEEELARRRERAELESLNEILRKPKLTEKRILGFLTAIDCSGDGMIYTVKSEEKILKLSSQSFDSVAMIAFDSGMAEKKIGCGTLKNESYAVFIYRPEASANQKIVGEVASIQFVPKSFRFLY